MNISKENLLIRNERISKALTGKKLSDAHKLKLSLAKKGKTYPNSLGRTFKMPPGWSERASEQRRKEWETGKRKSGWKLSDESRKRISLSLIGNTRNPGTPGELHWNWKGGISKDVHSVSEPKYKEWRMSVFRRDNFQCKICKTKVGLQAHHILKWSEFPELRYDINNGITLCLAHHPRKVAEEKRLVSEFQKLVSVSNDSY